MSDKQKKYLKIVAIALIVLAIAIGVYYYIIKPKTVNKSTTPPAVQPGTTPSTITPHETTKADDSFPLKQGSVGHHVLTLQKSINILHPDANLTEDGILGPETYTATVYYLGTSYFPVTENNLNDIINQANDIINQANNK
jgi:hypothetical protein